MESLIDLDCNDTEAFVHMDDNKDIRDVLEKKNLDFSSVINKIGCKLVYIKSGTTGHTFRGFNPNDSNDNNFAVKFVLSRF